jgi:hypothetical protein
MVLVWPVYSFAACRVKDEFHGSPDLRVADAAKAAVRAMVNRANDLRVLWF